MATSGVYNQVGSGAVQGCPQFVLFPFYERFELREFLVVD